MDVTLPLLSVGKVCDSHYMVEFRKGDMLIANKNDINIELLDEPLVTGSRVKTGLWKIPIPKCEWVILTPILTRKELALSTYNQWAEEDIDIYLHTSTGSPVINMDSINKRRILCNMAKT